MGDLGIGMLLLTVLAAGEFAVFAWLVVWTIPVLRSALGSPSDLSGARVVRLLLPTACLLGLGVAMAAVAAAFLPVR